MSHFGLHCAASEVGFLHCILALNSHRHSAPRMVSENLFATVAPLSPISNFTDRPFHAAITRFGNSSGYRGTKAGIHGKLLIYTTALEFWTYFWGVLLFKRGWVYQ